GALHLMAVRDYAPAEDRAKRAAERMRALHAVLDDARENLTGAAPVLASTAASVARSGLALIEYLLPVHLGKALEDDDVQFSQWENVRRGAAEALSAFADWLDELVPRATGHFAIGREAFETKVRYIHGLHYKIGRAACRERGE